MRARCGAEVVTFVLTLSLAKTTFDTVKEAMDFARSTKNADLAVKLVDAYRDIVELTETNQQLRAEISKLTEQADIEKDLKFNARNGTYTLMREGKEDGPFCGTCWDVDRRLVRTREGTGGPFCDWCSNRRLHSR